MSKDWITISETANLLGVSERWVRSFIAKGNLSFVQKRGDRKKYLDPLEVEEFRKAREEHRAVVTPDEFQQVRARLRRVENQLNVVLRILDAKDNPLKITEDYGKELYRIGLNQLKKSQWTLEEVHSWAEVFLRIDEEDFQVLAKATGESKAWTVLLRLCVAMIAYVSTRSDYSTSLDWQTTHRTLHECRRRLRVSGFCYGEMTGLTSDYRDAKESIQDVLTFRLNDGVKNKEKTS